MARLYLASGGYHELYVNGRRPDDRVLAPAPTQYDRHVRYICYDVSSLLRQGDNTLEIWLGNGWYDCGTATRWNTQSAPWRDAVKCCCDLVVDGKCLLWSDSSWQWALSPITFNELRNGESYDARLEDREAAWSSVEVVPSPGGIPVAETEPPCRVVERIQPCKKTWLSGIHAVYDFGVNISGVCEIELSGPAGAEATMVYGEHLQDSGDINNAYFDSFIQSGPFQTDRYILKGSGVEKYRARFTYHGFRYMCLVLQNADVKVHSVTACWIHNDFAEAGRVSGSDPVLNSLQSMARRSFLCNFVGIPTDCPHREKNGWTGDAMLAAEMGLWNYDCQNGFADFLQTVVDTQRPSGQLPGVAPTAGFGYNGWAGPAWDSIIFEYPYQVYRFTGSDALIREHYGAMERYIGFCQSMTDDRRLVQFGLGDWCHPDRNEDVPVRFVTSAYYYSDLLRMAKFARWTGRGDGMEYDGEAELVRQELELEFQDADNLTVLGGMLYFGIVSGEKRALAARRLADAVAKARHESWFGMHGAKWVPRALSQEGYIDDAFRIFTQPNFPGWGYWVACHDTALNECWNRTNSRTHVLFGDVSAWEFEFLGGISPREDAPGFRRFDFVPCFPKGMESFEAEHKVASGTIRSAWRRMDDGSICIKLDVPPQCEAEARIRGLEKKVCGAGSHEFKVSAP